MKAKSVVQVVLSFCLVLLSAASGAESTANINKALVIVSSESLQTQGMAMVLANTMQAKVSQVQVLLCDKAGDLALIDSESGMLKPKNVSPKMLLNKLSKEGASISVCALYLPNSVHTQADLIEDVGVAKPGEIATLMLDKNIRVFTF